MTSRNPARANPPAVPLAALAALALAAPIAGQQPAALDAEGYLAPPEEIREALLAPWHLNVEIEEASPDGLWLVVERQAHRMPPLEAFAKPHVNLGGLQVDTRANRERGFTTDSPEGLVLISAEDGREVAVEVPEGAQVSDPRFSPDGRRLAFFVHTDDATHLWVADPATGDARRVTRTPVLATLTTDFAWSGDGSALFTVLVPEDRGPEPVEPAVATTPGIWHTQPEKNELRTYPALLETPHEFALLRHHGTGQLARVDVADGEVRRIGAPAMIAFVDPAPGGEHVRVRTVVEPFSDIVAVDDYATVDEVWDLEGRVLAELDRGEVDDGADDEEDEDSGRRMIAWRPDGAGLSFAEGEPDEDGDVDTDEDEDDEERGDRVLQWLPPFAEGAARVVYRTPDDVEDVAYTADGSRLFVTTRDGDDQRLVAVAPGAGSADTLYVWDSEDFYDDPGELLIRPGPRGGRAVRVSSDGGSVYLSGTRYHEDPLRNAPQPFVDRVAVATGERERVFESAPDRYEQPTALDDDLARVVLERESRTDVPDFFVRDLRSGDETRLTENRNYAPDLTSQARREVLEVERADGVRFWVHVTLPANYAEGTRLPAMFWHYPSEYESAEDYAEDNRDYNRNEFPSVAPRSMEHLLRRGWAVVEPDIPIIGPTRESWNDNYTAHLRNSFAAAIDALDERGWIDRRRLAVGGHSYGGFGTINTMIHTPFFKAGIAGASNTNRTLTPAGFQREPRTLWEGRETYIRMSPIFWLNELTGALLMYHDMEDQNVGTFPIHSWRAFHGLNALGKTAALYMYPYEAHGPRAQETVMDLWTRWTAWLDLHVLGEGERGVADGDAGGR